MLSGDENIARAICSDKYDAEHDRISPSVFKGERVSVSRLALISLEDHWEIFRKHVEKPPERLLELIGEINVGHLQQLGLDYDPPRELSVEAKPEDWNPAHAEIPQNITRGLASKIIEVLKRHYPS